MARPNRSLKINPKQWSGGSRPCMKEMISFLNCLATSRMDDEKCVRQKELLNACMDAQSQRKPWGSINYHLKRLSKGRK